MSEAEALDMAAKAAGWGSWDFVTAEGGPMLAQSIRAHAKAVMENAALKAENERLREALRIYAGPMEWTQEGGWGVFPVWADGYPGGVYVDDNTLDYGDAARAALERIDHDRD